jgi:hypothetical protein
MRLAAGVLLLTLAAACSSNDAPTPAPPTEQELLQAPPAPVGPDARMPPIAALPPGGTDIEPELGSAHAARVTHRTHFVELILRSTPPGATAAVNGIVAGTTPTYWQGEVSDRPVDVTFVLPGHALARYRFVPVRSGVVHASLDPLIIDERAGQ